MRLPAPPLPRGGPRHTTGPQRGEVSATSSARQPRRVTVSGQLFVGLGLDEHAIHDFIAELLERLGFDVGPREPTSELSKRELAQHPGERQRRKAGVLPRTIGECSTQIDPNDQ